MDIGVPEEASFSALLYNKSAGVLIVSVTVGSGVQARERLFARGVTDGSYRELPYAGGPLLTYRDPVVASDAPMLYFLQWRQIGAGFEWDALLAYDLRKSAVVTICNNTSLVLPEGASRSWIAALHGVDASGRYVICTVATEMPKENSRGTTVRYELATLDVERCLFQRETELRASFF